MSTSKQRYSHRKSDLESDSDSDSDSSREYNYRSNKRQKKNPDQEEKQKVEEEKKRVEEEEKKRAQKRKDLRKHRKAKKIRDILEKLENDKHGRIEDLIYHDIKRSKLTDAIFDNDAKILKATQEKALSLRQLTTEEETIRRLNRECDLICDNMETYFKKLNSLLK